MTAQQQGLPDRLEAEQAERNPLRVHGVLLAASSDVLLSLKGSRLHLNAKRLNFV